jgi:hypothetical protein
VDWSSELADGKALAFAVKSKSEINLNVGLGCAPGLECKATEAITVAKGDWREVQIPLRCYAAEVDLSKVDKSLLFAAPSGAQIGLADIRLVTPANRDIACE